MNLGRATAILAITLLALGTGTAVAAVPTHAPAYAESASAAPASGSAAVATVVTPQCKKAKKAVKNAWKARETARRSGNIQRFIKADLKWQNAKSSRKRICALPASAFTPQPKPEATLSGNPKDPRPAGWVRPADGSGEPGSNASYVSFEVSGCPVTVSSVKFAPFGDSWYLQGFLQNYTDKRFEIWYRATLVDADGTVFDTGTYDGDIRAWGGDYPDRDSTSLTFLQMGIAGGPFDPTTARVVSFRVVGCRAI